jgi:hypothetical protein
MTLADYRKQHPIKHYAGDGVSFFEWREETRKAWVRLTLLDARSRLQEAIQEKRSEPLADTVNLILDALSEARL